MQRASSLTDARAAKEAAAAERAAKDAAAVDGSKAKMEGGVAHRARACALGSCAHLMGSATAFKRKKEEQRLKQEAALQAALKK